MIDQAEHQAVRARGHQGTKEWQPDAFAHYSTVERSRSYDRTIIERMLAAVADGFSLRQIAELPGMPSLWWLREWLGKDAELATQFARAKEHAADGFFEEMNTLIDAEPERLEDGRIDPGWVQLQKNRVEVRRVVAERLRPKKYGPRVELEHSGTVATLTGSDVRKMLDDCPLLRQLDGPVIDVPQLPATE